MKDFLLNSAAKYFNLFIIAGLQKSQKNRMPAYEFIFSLPMNYAFNYQNSINFLFLFGFVRSYAGMSNLGFSSDYILIYIFIEDVEMITYFFQ